MQALAMVAGGRWPVALILEEKGVAGRVGSMGSLPSESQAHIFF